MRILLALALVGTAAGVAHAQPKAASFPTMAPLDQYLIADRAVEIALARSAAPASITGDATILVLTKRGYETAVTGKNGFVCFVDRSWQNTVDNPELWNPKIRAPTCFNAPAARSVLPFQNQLTAFALSGATREQIAAKLKPLLAAKTTAPETGAMAYMMSKDQHLGEGVQHWHPHLMFFYPSTIDGPMLGANLPSSPILSGPNVVPGLGTMPYIVFFVPLDRWSDGAPAAMHEH